MAFSAGSAAVGDPDVQLDRVAAQDAQPFPLVAQLCKAESALESATALRSSDTGSAGTAARNRTAVVVTLLRSTPSTPLSRHPQGP